VQVVGDGGDGCGDDGLVQRVDEHGKLCTLVGGTLVWIAVGIWLSATDIEGSHDRNQSQLAAITLELGACPALRLVKSYEFDVLSAIWIALGSSLSRYHDDWVTRVALYPSQFFGLVTIHNAGIYYGSEKSRK
jgi:hypothetical protein